MTREQVKKGIAKATLQYVNAAVIILCLSAMCHA
jgi:hypothetical protein